MTDYISKIELDEFVKLFPNVFDKVYCYMLYEGFTAEQILCMKRSDISKNTVRTFDGHCKKVSQETLDLIYDADNQDGYYVYNYLHDGMIKKEICQSDYIIKFPVASKEDSLIETADIETRHRRMQRKIYKIQREKKDGVIRISEKILYFSGMVTALKPLVDAHGGDIEKAFKEDKELFYETICPWDQMKWNACKIYNRYMGT